MTFKLDPTLEKDSVLLGELDGFSCRVINDSRYIWLILVPTLNDISEIYQLDHTLQLRLSDLSATLGKELMNLYNGESLNVAALGNVVRQLHIHHIVRNSGDAAWPGPVWGHGKAVPFTDEKLADLMTFLQENLSILKN